MLRGGFVEVPPPVVAPTDQFAETLGLLQGLRAEKKSYRFRCANCSTMQQSGSWLVWVPDSVMKNDDAEEVIEQCRQSAYNGSGSGWCLPCAKGLGKSPLRVRIKHILFGWR